MDTDSFYLALSEDKLENVILPDKRDQWNATRSRDCTDASAATQQNFYISESVATHTRNAIRGKQVSLKGILDVPNRCVYAVKRNFAMIERVTSTNLVAKV